MMLTGKDLAHKTLIKFLETPSVSWFGFPYVIGKNTDSLPFNPHGSCMSGGLSFTDLEHMHDFQRYGKWIALIALDPYEPVYKEPHGDKYKAHSIHVTEIAPIQECSLWSQPRLYSEMIHLHGWSLQYIKYHTTELSLKAVQQNASALKFIKHQTKEMCMEAVRQKGKVLKWVIHQTPDICLTAVQCHGRALVHVIQQTEQICLAAVKTDGSALVFVEKQTPEICLAAVENYGKALEFVSQQTPELCLAAVKRDGWALRFVCKQTPEICQAALKQNHAHAG